MPRKSMKFITYFLVLAFLASNLLSFGISPQAFAETPPQTADPGPLAIRGIPGINEKLATPEDVAYIKNKQLTQTRIEASVIPSLNSQKSFYAYNEITGISDLIPSTLKRVSEHSYIYLQNTMTVSDAVLDGIASQFENIYKKNTQVFGNPPDIDQDKRINILLLDIQDKAPEPSYIAGFFDSVNQLPKIYYEDSNECEIFYIDVNEGLSGPVEEIYGTLAHEFQHMIQYEVYLKNYDSTFPFERTWLNEAMSGLAEYINFNQHPLAHIESYLADELPSGYGLMNWSGTLANYGASYLFGLYLYEKFGEQYITDLVQDIYSGAYSVERQFEAHGINKSFYEVFDKMQIASIIDNGDPSPDEYGYATIDLSSIRNSNNLNFPDMTSYYPCDFPIDTNKAPFRSNAAFINDLPITAGAIQMNLTTGSGIYYMITPVEGTPINTPADFYAAPKQVTKIDPFTLTSMALGSNQWALLAYIAEDYPVNDFVHIDALESVTDTPTVPAGLDAQDWGNAVGLFWNPSSYSKGLKAYEITRSPAFTESTLVNGTEFIDINVTAGTPYTYTIEAIGYDDVRSGVSAPVSITLDPMEPYTINPPSIEYVDTSVIDAFASITINIIDPLDNTNVVGHRVASFLNGMSDGYYNVTPAGIVTLDWFEPGELYTLYAVTFDDYFNTSVFSNKINVIAGVGLQSEEPYPKPTTPSALSVLNTSQASITIGWTPSAYSAGIKEYNVFRNGIFAATTSAIQYIDSEIQRGVEYKYTVEAVGNNHTVGNNTYNLNSDISAPLTVTNWYVEKPSPSIPGGTYTTEQSIVLALDGFAASTYYTIDGSEPTTSSGIAYTSDSAITIGTHGATITLKAKSFAPNGSSSDTLSAAYTFDMVGPVAPTASVPGGTYTTGQSVTLTPAIDAVSTFYTLDGSVPDSSDTPYTVPIAINGAFGETITLNAVSYDEAGNKGSILTQAYTFSDGPDAPTASISGGTYNSPLPVTLTPDADAVSTYYTLDGSDPDKSKTLYNLEDTITIDGSHGESIVLKAVSYNASNITGSVLSVTYTFDKQGPAAPTASVAGGTYNSARNVLLTPAADAHHTFYTTDGTAPSHSSTTYSGIAIPIDGSNGETVTLKAVSYDIYGNEGAVLTVSYIFDKTAPAAPVIDSVDGDTGVTGIGNTSTPAIVISGVTSGDFIRVYDSSTVVGSATASGVTATITTEPLSEGQHQLKATSTDPYGNESSPSAIFTFTVDTIPPGQPTIVSVAGNSSSPATANVTGPAIQISGLTVGETIHIYDGATTIASITVTANTQTITLPELSEGSHTLSAKAGDASGSFSLVSIAFTYIVDITAPAVPVIESVNGDTSSPCLSNDNTPSVIINNAEAGSTIIIYDTDGTTSMGSITATGATATITLDPMIQGIHQLKAEAIDPYGNASALSTAFEYQLDVTAPDAPTFTSVNGVLATPAVGQNTAPVVIIGGLTSGDLINIYDTDGVTIVGTVTASGVTATVTLSTLSEGLHSLTIKAIDPAGNISSPSAIFAYTVDTIAPSKPVINSVNGLTSGSTSKAQNPEVNIANVEAGALVEIFDGATLVGSITSTGASVTLTVSTTLDEGPHSLTVKATDAAGNQSVASDAFTYTVDITPPGTPVIVSVNGETSTPALGKNSNPVIVVNNTVSGDMIKVHDSVSGSIVANGAATGTSIILTLNNLSEAVHQLTVTATDIAGNVSTTSSAFSYTVDLTAPLAPEIQSVNGKTTSPAKGSDTTPDVVVGNIVSEDTLEVFVDDVSVKTVISTGTAMTITLDALLEGEHDILIKSTDPAGNTSTSSSAFTYEVDLTAPVLQNAVVAAGNEKVTLTFSEGVFSNVNGTGALEASDFTFTFDLNGGTMTSAAITSVTRSDGTALQGGESTIRLNLTITGISIDGLESITFGPADGTSIYDEVGHAMVVTTTTSALKEQIVPTVTCASVTIQSGGTIKVQSSEEGFVYLVPQNTYADKAALDAAVNGLIGTKVQITTSSGIEITITVPTQAGSYKAYAVDLAGNISLASSGTVTVFTPSVPVYSPPPAPVVPTPEPPKITTNPGQPVRIDVTPVLDPSTGGASSTISMDVFDDAIEQAKPDSAGDKKVIVVLPEVDGAEEYAQTLPSSALSSEASNYDVVISTPMGSVTAPANMFDADDVKGAKEVSISVGRADPSALDSSTRELIGNRPIIELSALVDGKTKEWSNPDAPVTISFSYHPTKEELANPDNITVWYIDGKGNAVAVPNAKYDPSTGLITFKTTHFSRYAAVYVTKTFKDSGTFGWATKYIDALASKGIVQGKTADSYLPADNVTRADFIYYLINALGLSASFDSNFTDVKTTDYFYNAVGIAKKLGITSGVGNNKFGSQSFITRQDMMTMTLKALRLAGITVAKGSLNDIKHFTDYKNITNYAVDGVATLVKAGVIAGSNNKITPNGFTTRAALAVVLYKIYSMK